MPIKVKICGVTSLDDAMACVEAGADALGLNFYPDSPRYLSVGKARAITKYLPPFVARVGLFVDADEETVRRTAEETGINTLQFHGDESPEFCANFAPMKVIKAFRMQGAQVLKQLADYNVDAWLLDSFTPGMQGGTGTVFNWDLARQAKDEGKPIILAGGLNPENIAEAIHETRPYAVDVSSGVEIDKGKKDIGLVQHFINTVRQVEQEIL
ncbi:MAG: phosphoribosylanthranilate isomerase [Verrucomicrobiales bacterium]|nr:phosphoribosylanthranilate isomerase [Verrucomicrobiales bacterium]|tara:strand:- start:1605 stop:2240 length:636 start_codon:yes stop_codon:yes gene_type:complete